MGEYLKISAEYYKILTEYVGIVSWFIILVAAKLSHISTRKKLTQPEVLRNVIYCVVGGIIAYYGTFTFRSQIRIIALGVGVLAGDTLVKWIMDSMEDLLKTVTASIKKYIKKKFEDN